MVIDSVLRFANYLCTFPDSKLLLIPSFMVEEIEAEGKKLGVRFGSLIWWLVVWRVARTFAYGRSA